MNACLDGTYDYGACGIVPLIRVDGNKPTLKNNGYNEYSGVPALHVPGLSGALPDDGRPIRQGHVMLLFSDGQRFGSYVGSQPGDVYRFC